MKFTKMESAGNDFIILDNRQVPLSSEQLSRTARKLCQRRLSIGADALIAIEGPVTPTELKIKMFNADGSTLAMCSNGVRCAAGYAFERRLAEGELWIETCGKRVHIRDTGPRYCKLQLDPPDRLELENTFRQGQDVVSYTNMDLGGMPHAVIHHKGLTIEDAQNEGLLGIARSLRYNQRYPQGVNVSFYDSPQEGEATVITYERGPEAFTPSCGIGACAAVIARMLQNEASSIKLKVRVPMGEYLIEADFDQKSRKISALYLSGDIRMVAEGQTLADEWEEES